eukprot:TRINITY_DN52712_c0_g1_i1.p1 TRINITY_DN52712_c0_g1~~TRINITY_DN52712_c0_g1_i1.p1  ORF type:complete len:347 (-),score=59.06 TRINITY_DN52712_c0_g1_i1:47-1087(-)
MATSAAPPSRSDGLHVDVTPADLVALGELLLNYAKRLDVQLSRDRKQIQSLRSQLQPSAQNVQPSMAFAGGVETIGEASPADAGSVAATETSQGTAGISCGISFVSENDEYEDVLRGGDGNERGFVGLREEYQRREALLKSSAKKVEDGPDSKESAENSASGKEDKCSPKVRNKMPSAEVMQEQFLADDRMPAAKHTRDNMAAEDAVKVHTSHSSKGSSKGGGAKGQQAFAATSNSSSSMALPVEDRPADVRTLKEVLGGCWIGKDGETYHINFDRWICDRRDPQGGQPSRVFKLHYQERDKIHWGQRYVLYLSEVTPRCTTITWRCARNGRNMYQWTRGEIGAWT